MASFKSLYPQINWQAPWYHTLTIPPYQANSRHVKDWLNACLTAPILIHQNQPIYFVSQDELPANTAYETHIAKTGNIPTRDNLHDLLGGLIWLNYPKTKAVLNYLHTLDIATNGIHPHRSPLRNALTLLDENGGVVLSSNLEVLQQLKAFDWEKALIKHREQWLNSRPQIQFFPFGHALLEKLVAPRNNITSHVLLCKVSTTFFELPTHEQRNKLDEALANCLLDNYQTILVSKNFQPLPVMGIPSFCEQNARIEFYQNKMVFREPRERKAIIVTLLDFT